MTRPTKRHNWQEQPPKDWAEREAYRVARSIEALRGRRSAQWIADRTKALGHEVTRSVLSDLENGRRRYITTSELAVLSAALNVSPVSLLYPDPSDELSNLVEVLPGVQVTGFQAAQWFSGHRTGFADRGSLPTEKPGSDGRESADSRAEHEQNTRELRLWRKIDELRELQRSQSFVPLRGELTDTQRALIETYGRQIADLKRELGLPDDA